MFSFLFSPRQAELILAVATGVLCFISLSHAQSKPDYADVASIFSEHCVLCHNGAAAPKGLRLDSYESVKKGSENGPIALPGNATGSELVKRITGASQPRMPLTGPPFLSDDKIKLITDWIDTGMNKGEQAAPTTPPPKRKQPGDNLTYSDVMPIFAQRCVKCHRDDAPNGPPERLSLKTYDAITRGGERVVIIPGAPGASELVRRIRGIARPRMPFDGPPWLSDEQIALIESWIQQGAKNDDGSVAPPPVGQRVRLHGRLTARWALDGVPLVVDSGTRLKKNPNVGDYVRVRGYVGEDGRIHATRIRPR